MATTRLKGRDISLVGNEVNIGAGALEITALNSEGLANKIVGGTEESIQLLLAIPSLGTPVCATQTHKFNEEASRLVALILRLYDLPFAAGGFCSTEGISNIAVASDFRDKRVCKSICCFDGRWASCRVNMQSDICSR